MGRLFTDSELDRFCASFALDVAAPVELALASLFHSGGKVVKNTIVIMMISKTTKSEGPTEG